MSRVYDALRQWSRERGVSQDLLDFREPAPQITEEPDESPQEQVLQWNEIADFVAIWRPEDRLTALRNGNELGTEKFRLLQSRLRQLSLQKPIKTVVITSAVPTDGKSLIATNLAISLAKHSNAKVMLLEGDLHKPGIADKIGLGTRTGFADWLTASDPMEKSIYHLRESNLWILPAGSTRKNPLGLLQSPKCAEGLALLQASFDWILIDSPPLLPLADGGFWIQQSDGALLIVRPRNTPRKLLERSLEMIEPAKILGVVLNYTEPTEHDYYNRYYRPAAN